MKPDRIPKDVWFWMARYGVACDACVRSKMDAALVSAHGLMKDFGRKSVLRMTVEKTLVSSQGHV